MDREERIDPPIQTEYFRSGAAMTLTLLPGGTSDVISFEKRSARPGNKKNTYLIIKSSQNNITIIIYFTTHGNLSEQDVAHTNSPGCKV